MSVTDETVSFSLELNVDEFMTDLRRVQAGVNRLLSILQQYTGDPTLKGAIARLQQILLVINQIRLAIAALNATSGPIGWFLFGVSAISAAVSVDMMIRRPR